MPIWELPASNFDAPPGFADGGANSLATAITRDAAYFGKFGLGYRREASDYSVTCGGIYTATSTGLYTAHCLGAVYRVTWMFRVRSLPSGEHAIVAFSSAINPQYAGYLTISALGIIKLYSSGSGAPIDVAAINGQADLGVVPNTWYIFDFYIDWAEAALGGGSTASVPAVVSLGVGVPGGGAAIIGVDPTTASFLGDAGLGKGLGNGVSETYLTSVFFMPTGPVAGPPATLGEYDFDGITILQYDQAPVVNTPYSGLSGYTLNTIGGGPLQYLVAATALTVDSIPVPGSWTLNDGSPPDRRAWGEFGGQSQVASGGLKSSVSGDAITIRYTSTATLPVGPRSAAIGVSFFTSSYPVGNLASISVNGGPVQTIVPAAGFWRGIWIRGTVGGGGNTFDVTLTHPADTFTLNIQDLVVQAVGQPAAAPTSIVTKVASGTYVGNDTAQSINIAAVTGASSFRPAWIFISKNSASGKGVVWWDSMLLPQDWSKATVRSAELTPTATGFDVIGTAPQTNAAGVTYRWYAIEDLSRRALFYGGAGATSGTTVTLGAPLTDFNAPPAAFTTKALWAHAEALTAAGSANGGYFRGISHTGLNSNPFDTGQVTNAIRSLPAPTTWDVGTRVTQNQPQFAFTCWGTDFSHVVLWAVTSYTGDGTNPRNVFVDLGGRRPGWCLVVPHNDLSWVRVFSMPANTSQQMDGGSSGTDAIRAFATDQITVGGTLNSLGIVYEVLAIVDPTDSGATSSGTLEDTGADLPCVVSFPLGTDSGGGVGCQVSL